MTADDDRGRAPAASSAAQPRAEAPAVGLDSRNRLQSLGRIICPLCGRGPYAVAAATWQLRPHGPRDVAGHYVCAGPDADDVFCALLGLPADPARPGQGTLW